MSNDVAEQAEPSETITVTLTGNFLIALQRGRKLKFPDDSGLVGYALAQTYGVKPAELKPGVYFPPKPVDPDSEVIW